MQQVWTTKGNVDRDQLTVEDIVTEGDNHRAIATEWKLNGELVRRDVHVMILTGQAVAGEQAAMG